MTPLLIARRCQKDRPPDTDSRGRGEMSLERRVRNLGGRQARILGHEHYLKTAVLVPLVEYEGQTCVLFEKRIEG